MHSSTLIMLFLTSFTLVSAAPVQARSASIVSRSVESDRKKLAPLKSQHAAILAEEKNGNPTTQSKLLWNKHRKMLVDSGLKVDLQPFVITSTPSASTTR
ncbi:hypothetical protein C8J56DRAFT_987129 [Mycena floridula]|nr:hypothetical protein C8J56DRAFT_987129 [Mycena floridula]